MPDIITMPDELYGFTQTKFNVVTLNTTSGPSSFNPILAINGPQAQFWALDLTFTLRDADDADALARFFLKLKGGKVLARIYDLARVARSGVTQPRGAGGAGPVVNIAADALAGADTIVLKNLLPSQAVALRYQDHLGIGENLYPIEDSTPSDSSGEASVKLGIPLWIGVAEGDAVNLVKPTGLFRVTQGDADLTRGDFYRSLPLTASFMQMPDFG